MGERPQVLVTSVEGARKALENLDDLDLANTLEPPRKKHCQALNSTSTSVLDRLIHVDPCANVLMKRILDVVRQQLGKYQVGVEDREAPWVGLEFLERPEASRERALRIIPGYKFPGSLRRIMLIWLNTIWGSYRSIVFLFLFF